LSGAGKRSTPRLILAPSDGGEGQSVAWLIPVSLSHLSFSSSLVGLFSHLSSLVASPGVFLFFFDGEILHRGDRQKKSSANITKDFLGKRTPKSPYFEENKSLKFATFLDNTFYEGCFREK
jgi:hypothetical protein